MHIVAAEPRSAFAVWITGLPASGKSTIARALREQLAQRGVDVAVLESDALRPIFTPQPRYDDDDRAIFYGALAYVGMLLTEHGVPVIFDATANRRTYREKARRQIPRFVEVFVDCPLSTCIARDPKGIYRQGLAGSAGTVPGLHVDYEPPQHADLVLHCEQESTEASVHRVLTLLADRGFITR